METDAFNTCKLAASFRPSASRAGRDARASRSRRHSPVRPIPAALGACTARRLGADKAALRSAPPGFVEGRPARVLPKAPTHSSASTSAASSSGCSRCSCWARSGIRGRGAPCSAPRQSALPKHIARLGRQHRQSPRCVGAVRSVRVRHDLLGTASVRPRALPGVSGPCTGVPGLFVWRYHPRSTTTVGRLV